jgi:hypothetical protein
MWLFVAALWRGDGVLPILANIARMIRFAIFRSRGRTEVDMADAMFSGFAPPKNQDLSDLGLGLRENDVHG